MDRYQDGQPVAYKMLTKVLKKKQINHAYLFRSNYYLYAEDLALAFAKALICPQHYTNLNQCLNCNICWRIDNNNYNEIKIIKPDGLWIKKEQLISLQEQFSYKALEGVKRVYIMFEAEKMNLAAANCILKFLEEPAADIIAILVTNYPEKMLPTITSRCQIVSLKPNKIEDYLDYFTDVDNKTFLKLGLLQYQNEHLIKTFIGNPDNEKKIAAVIDFINQYENKHLDVLLKIKQLWYDYFKTKEDFILAFDIMLYFYKDILNYLCLKRIEVFNDYQVDVKNNAAINKADVIISKLRVILMIKEKIKGNLNLGLLLDKLIISLERS